MDNTEIFTNDYKLHLVKKIANIKNKINLKCIYDIIHDNNKNIDFILSKNNNGIYINFGILSEITYKKINDFLTQNIRTKNKKNLNSANSYISHIINDYPFDKELLVKYSNKEKMLIKKKYYVKELTESNEEQSNLIKQNNKNILFF